MRVMLNCSECAAEIEDWSLGASKRPFSNLCYVCALAIYIERLASFALRREPKL
jgi:hypothetical protein